MATKKIHRVTGTAQTIGVATANVATYDTVNDGAEVGYVFKATFIGRRNGGTTAHGGLIVVNGNRTSSSLGVGTTTVVHSRGGLGVTVTPSFDASSGVIRAQATVLSGSITVDWFAELEIYTYIP